jgi:hypothetical protein
MQHIECWDASAAFILAIDDPDEAVVLAMKCVGDP